MDEGALLSIYDPKVSYQQICRDLNHSNGTTNGHVNDKGFEVMKSPYEAALKAHAIVICTEWDEFKTYDYCKIYDGMEKPAFIFDGRKMMDHDMLEEIGFKVKSIGKNLDHKNNHLLI